MMQQSLVNKNGDDALKPTKIIRENYLRNFLLILLLIILVGTTVSAAVLYFNLHRPLDTHYSAILSIITEVRESIIINALKINLTFYLLIAAGVGVLTLISTHRIAGPLYRIQMSAKAITEGKLYTVIHLRQKDVISSFADSINEMTANYADKAGMIDTEVQQIKSSMERFKELREKNEDTESLSAEIAAHNNKIKEIIDTVKL